MPGLRVEADAIRLLEIVHTPTMDQPIWEELQRLATSIYANAQDINERVSRAGSYAMAE